MLCITLLHDKDVTLKGFLHGHRPTKLNHVTLMFSVFLFYTSSSASTLAHTTWYTHLDENQQAFKDPLHVLVGPITRARSKKIKEALNGLIQEIWADSNAGHSQLGPKEDEGVINLIQAIEG